MQPLTIGNIITVGLQLYRSHLKLYLKLSLIAHLWLLIPIYGWAKFFATSALISRLAFSNLIPERESFNAAKTHTYRKLWSFLIVGILVILIPLLFSFIGVILFSIIFGLIYGIVHVVSGLSLPAPPNSNNPFADPVSAAIFLPLGVLIYLSPLWFYSRLFITDLTLGIETNNNPFKGIKQSWKLTKGYRIRLVAIILISFSITFPVLLIIWQGLSRILSLLSYNFLRLYVAEQSIRLTLILIILSLLTGIVIMPFWQAIKAVTYYDLRCRRESLDLKIRDQL